MMYELNQRNKPILLVGLTIIFLIALSFLPGGIEILGYKLKPVDLFMDIKPDSLLVHNSEQNQNLFHNNSKNFNSETFKAEVNLDLLVSALMRAGNSINNYKNISLDNTLVSFEKLSGNISQMRYFFDALKQSNYKKIRIAHYGDSEIEGDLITGNVRQNLQEKFGGEGVGFLSITSQDISFRTTTKQTFSDNWKTVSVLTGNTEKLPLGINGYVAIPQGNSWVKYKTTRRYNSVGSFGIARVFYTNAKNSSVKYTFDNEGEQTARLKPGSGVQELILKPKDGIARSVKINTTMANQAVFYGVSLESSTGLYVDNFPFRGNSGVGLKNLSAETLKEFNRLLNYKLIILNFGMNMVSSGSNDFRWYKKEMIKIINNLKSIFPQTSILIVGVGDKSVKRGSRFITDPNIPKFIKVQEDMAEKTGVAFWNLFEAMGGMNAMNSWVNANPPLAFKDYTHVNLQGADKIGEMMSMALLDEFKKYK